MVRKRRGGFTLIEAMLVVAIVGIIFAVAPRIFIQVTRFFVMSRTRVELQREARSAMSLMTQNLRQAQTDSIKIDQVSGQPYYSRIRFVTVQGSTVTYNQSGTQLTQTVGTKVNTMTKNLSYLAFTFPRSDDLSIVSVSLTLEKGIYEGLTKALHMASEKVEVMN